VVRGRELGVVFTPGVLFGCFFGTTPDESPDDVFEKIAGDYVGVKE
jgi:hypothetical protein